MTGYLIRKLTKIKASSLKINSKKLDIYTKITFFWLINLPL